jgi:hypothetical protein
MIKKEKQLIRVEIISKLVEQIKDWVARAREPKYSGGLGENYLGWRATGPIG